KVIEYNGGYPELQKIIIDYLADTTSIDLKTLYQYVNQLQGFWKDLIEQMIPSTAIWSGGLLYKNNVLNSQKHTYKHGVNFGSEFENEINHFKAPKIVGVKYEGEVNLPKEGNISNVLIDSSHISTLEFPSMIDEIKGSANVLHIRNQHESNKK